VVVVPGAVSPGPPQHRWLKLCFSQLIKLQNFGSFLGGTLVTKLFSLSVFKLVLCVVEWVNGWTLFSALLSFSSLPAMASLGRLAATRGVLALKAGIMGGGLVTVCSLVKLRPSSWGNNSDCF